MQITGGRQVCAPSGGVYQGEQCMLTQAPTSQRRLQWASLRLTCACLLSRSSISAYRTRSSTSPRTNNTTSRAATGVDGAASREATTAGAAATGGAAAEGRAVGVAGDGAHRDLGPKGGPPGDGWLAIYPHNRRRLAAPLCLRLCFVQEEGVQEPLCACIPQVKMARPSHRTWMWPSAPAQVCPGTSGSARGDGISALPKETC